MLLSISFTLSKFLSQFDCFNQNITLNGILSEQKFILQFTADTEENYCQFFLQNEMKVSVQFIQLSKQLDQSFIFNTSQNVIEYQVVFEIDFQSFILESEINVIISFGNGDFKFQLPVDKVVHDRFDSRNCWKNPYFAVIDQYTVKIQVAPLICQISQQVTVSVEYFDDIRKKWIKTLILPQIHQQSNTSYNGYTNNTNFKIDEVLFFESTTLNNNNQTNKDEIQQLISSYLNSSFMSIRLLISDNDPTKRLQHQYVVDIIDIRSDFSDSCNNDASYATLYDTYSFFQLNTSQIYTCLKNIQNIVQIKSFFHAQQQNKNWTVTGFEHNSYENFKNLVGLVFEFNQSINNDYKQNSLFRLNMLAVDSSDNILAVIYITGVMQQPCFNNVVFEVYSNKACVHMQFTNTSQCLKELTTVGISGNITCNLNNDITDATKRITYLWAKFSFKFVDYQTNKIQRICVNQHNDTNFTHGTRASGTFNQRMNQLQKNIVTKQQQQLSMLITPTQQYLITTIISYRYVESFYYAILIFGVILAIVLIVMGIACKMSFCKRLKINKAFYELTF